MKNRIIHTAIYKQISGSDLLKSIGSSTQYAVITCRGKESEKQ